jgi:hypothetical protein
MEYNKLQSGNCIRQNGWKMFYTEEYTLVGREAVTYEFIDVSEAYTPPSSRSKSKPSTYPARGKQQAELALGVLFDRTAATASNPAMFYTVPLKVP